MDGVTGVELFTAMHDFEARVPAEIIDPKPLLVEKSPGKMALLGNSYKNYFQKQMNKKHSRQSMSTNSKSD